MLLRADETVKAPWEYESTAAELQAAHAEVERLRKALDRAGDRLAQVQPGVTEPWAFDIIPKAEQEIADVLRRST